MLNTRKTISSLTFMFTLSLFFERDNVLLFFYTAFFLYVLYSISFTRSLRFKTNTPIVIKCYFAFAILSGASYFWAINPTLSSQMFIRIMSVCLLMLITYNNCKNYNLENIFFYSLSSGIIINFCLLVSPWRSFFISEQGRFSGTFTNANVLSIFVVFFIYFLSKKALSSKVFSPKIYSILVTISILLIFSTGSRKGFIVGSVLTVPAAVTLARHNKRFFIYCLFALFFMISFIIINADILTAYISQINVITRLEEFSDFINGGIGDTSTKWRHYYIEEGLKTFYKNPIIGIGIDNFKEVSGISYSHNNYVEMLATLGLLGFILYYSIYFYLVRHLVRCKANLLDFIMVFSLLFMDLALVSYYMRFYWISLMYIILTTEKFLKPPTKDYKVT